ncbi:patatin-like phospholipase family protein [Pasteurella multocida]|uniref:patatin-like phospholipase family protein n=1 Tax=Pasteurella multocida TaxID=747 RepID=UPI00193C3E09|nr:patatin-like phospholipase family protein [Pasteurella multocida]MBM2608464.1 patatin-like phospholipase family protein [Pasteurella multocida]
MQTSLSSSQPKKIALALSGGGIRAIVFHLGVLSYLAEQQRLEEITHISTVSGGSLVMGLIFQHANMKWPTSQQFLNFIRPQIKRLLCEKSLMAGSLKQFLNPLNLKHLFSRAHILSKAIQAEWGIGCDLQELPEHPEWSINATVGETGKRFRFKKNDLGDYDSGYCKTIEHAFPLCDAMAISAAFPVGIGPLAIESQKFTWYKRKWNEPPEMAKPITLRHKQLHLYDGGVYDNLGLEGFFDIAQQEKKAKLSEDTLLIVSDAGSPLDEQVPSLYKLVTRFMHLIDIIYNQNRSLRVRSLVAYLRKEKHRGVYLPIKTKIPQSHGVDEFAMQFPTSLQKLSQEEFDKLYQHGYNVCRKYYFFIADENIGSGKSAMDIF